MNWHATWDENNGTILSFRVQVSELAGCSLLQSSLLKEGGNFVPALVVKYF
jgi:hypothetical protein